MNIQNHIAIVKKYISMCEGNHLGVLVYHDLKVDKKEFEELLKFLEESKRKEDEEEAAWADAGGRRLIP